MYFVQSWKVYFRQVFFFTRSTTSSNCISVVPNYNIHSNNNLLLKYKLGKYFEHQTIQHLNDLLLLILIIPWISITYFSSATKFLILLKKKENIEIIKTLGTGFDSSRDITLYAWLMIWFDLLCLTPLSAIFQLYHGGQF
jgi:hypothetical protein